MLSNLRKTALNVLGSKGLTLKKYAPDMLLGFGIGMTLSAPVLAALDTPKAIKHVEEYKEEVVEIENTEEENPRLIALKLKLALKLLNDYKWALSSEIIGALLIYISHVLMDKRLASSLAAYGIVYKDFMKYRKKLIEKYGIDVDKELKYDLKKESITVEQEDEDGKIRKKKEQVETVASQPSGYAVMFDMGTPGWTKSPEANMHYLKKIENYCNELLRLRGYLFLNDVYDELDFPRTQAGQIVGWINDPSNPRQIDFGLMSSRWGTSFKYGLEPSVVIDFNVEGPIIDTLSRR